MKKYELRKNMREITEKDSIAEGCTLLQRDQEPEIIKTFVDIDEALIALKEYETDITKFGSSGGVFFKVTEYYIEENEYDDDGEWISGGDIWKFSKMPSEYEK